FDYVTGYDQRITKLLQPRFSSAPLVLPKFQLGDATRLCFPDESFDHINCCGSTLSYISGHDLALKEMARVLRPGGTFVLEVEAKYNFDFIWTFLDATILVGRLQYDTQATEAFRTAFSAPLSHVTVRYPFGDAQDPVYMDLKLFVRRKLIK